MMTIFAIAFGLVVGSQRFPIFETVAFAGVGAIFFALGRVVQFHMQEWAWVQVQIEKVGRSKYIRGQLMLGAVHVLWYGLLGGACTTLAYFWFR